jgi:hypothetical protein
VRRLPAVTSDLKEQHTGLSREALSPSTCRGYCEDHRAADGVGTGSLEHPVQEMPNFRGSFICRPEPPYDTYLSGSDSDDGFDDFPDVDGWSFGFGT